MNIYTRRILAAYLASATISLTAGVSEAALPKAEAFPVQLVENILDEVEGDDMDVNEKARAILAIANDKRTDVRVRVCDFLAVELERLPLSYTEQIFEKLAEDPELVVRRQLGRAVFKALDSASVLNRTRMVTHWALSDVSAVRRIAANALQQDLFCLGGSAVANHLADDEDVCVRAAVVSMVKSRHHENPAHYGPVLEKLTRDAEPAVREAATRLYNKMVRENASGVN